MGKISTILSNVAIGLGVMSSIYAQEAKIDNITIPVKEKLMQTISHNKGKENIDPQTQNIIKFMSNINNQAIIIVLKKSKKEISIDTIEPEEKDIALYETILEMNKKYGNPKITSKRSKIFNGKNYRGQFSPISNKIHINPRIYNNKQEMVGIWLSELSHAKQYQEKNMIPNILKDGITLIANNFEYEKLYNKKGTIEYEAHKKIEAKIYLEFIETYLRKIDKENPKEIQRAERRINFFIHQMTAEHMEGNAVQDMENIQKNIYKKQTTSTLQVNDSIQKTHNVH